MSRLGGFVVVKGFGKERPQETGKDLVTESTLFTGGFCLLGFFFLFDGTEGDIHSTCPLNAVTVNATVLIKF